MVAILCGFKSRFPHQEHSVTSAFLMYKRDLNGQVTPTYKKSHAVQSASNSVDYFFKKVYNLRVVLGGKI